MGLLENMTCFINKKSVVIVPFVLVCGLFLLFYFLQFYLGIYFNLNLAEKDILSNSITAIFGLAVVYFSYSEYLNRKESEKPKIAFDLSVNAYLLYSVGSDKPHGINDTETISLVIKNIGKYPIYNVRALLEAKIQPSIIKTSELCELTLMPKEFRILDTKIQIKEINEISNGICKITCQNKDFEGLYIFEYDFVKNRTFIIDYFKMFTENNGLTPILAYNTISNLKKGRYKRFNSDVSNSLHNIENILRTISQKIK